MLKQNNASSAYTTQYELIKSMKSRRKEALLNSWNNIIDHDADTEWLELNLLSKGLNLLEYEGCILYAASIWILDVLEKNHLIEKTYSLLPKSYDLYLSELQTMAIPNIWDIHFDYDLIAGIDYILYKRNSDSEILNNWNYAPVLINPSVLKGHKNNMKDQKSFNALMELLPKETKDRAAQHFKEIYQEWIKRFFDKAVKINDQDKKQLFVFSVCNSGLFTPKEYIEKYDSEYSKDLKSLPQFDPFELCFGLLYLIEQDNDLPWLIGACRGVMTEVIRRLPWGIPKSKESRSIYSKRLKDTNADSTKLLLPFDRVFHEDTDETAVNLMQIIYQETGCLLPRNIQNDQYISRLIEKYNIDQQTAQVIHYCSILLINSANFIEEPFDDYITEKTADHINAVSELKEMNEKASKEFKGLRSEFQKIKKQLDNTTKELERLKRKEQSELRELADLREIIFKDKNNIEDDTTVNEKEFPYTVTHKTIIFGGHEAWVNELKNKLKGEIRYVSADLIFDKDIVKNCEMLWIQTNVMSHNCFDRIKDASIKHGVPIRYFTYNGSKLCAKQLRENDIALNKV